MSHQGKQLLFILLAASDLALTWWLLVGSGGAVYEANPVARWCLDHYGWGGLAAFKGGAVATVLVVAWHVGRSRPDAAGRILILGCAASALVVVYSCVLTRYSPESLAADKPGPDEVERDEAYNRVVVDSTRQRAAFWERLTEDVVARRCTLREAVERLASTAPARTVVWQQMVLHSTPGRPLTEAMAACIMRHALTLTPKDPAGLQEVATLLEREFQVTYGRVSPVEYSAYLSRQHGHSSVRGAGLSRAGGNPALDAGRRYAITPAMNYLTVVSLGVGLLLAASPGLRAQSPKAEPVKGRVLVLENGRTIAGDIERDGDRYRIRRLTGETSVSAVGVLRLCASLEEALTYLRSRANLSDPDERLRLAIWCTQHALRDQAIAEVDAARALRPEDAHIRRMLAAMIDSKKRADAPPTPVTPEPTLPRVEVNVETLSAFAVKVQPIVMNACASCHTGGRGGSFQLKHPIAAGLTDRRAVDHNLAAVAALVDPSQPGRSKLLAKAVTVHAPGMVIPPLGKAHGNAIRALENWAAQLAASSPGVLPSASSVATAPPPPAVPIPTPAPMPAPAAPSRFGEDRPAAAPKEVVDPLGPDEFNREFHPKGKPAASPDR